MTKVLFSEMSLTPKVEKAVSLMGFDSATPIQSEAIPVIRTGVDVIARSQTGTGKTVAFAIPAIERIDTNEEKPTIQILILCPTRELAQQAEEEITKLTRFKENIHPVAIYGGAPIDKQCIALRRANIVVGTPGRVMDHMRRKSIKLDNLKMIVLDEADEMLNMGFKEDIETILSDTPLDRQTVLFAATMPPAIMKITNQFLTDPVLIEIDKAQITIDNIEQRYIDVPHSGKKEALLMLIQYYQPNRAIIFCGTKKMADELNVFLNDHNVSAESIHSDIKQTQRTSTMQGFKAGKTTILIATDIAARGIDVNDVDYVFNYDIPPNLEYYIHRIGRTGRAGKAGCSITICGTKREANEIRQIAIAVKSEIKELPMPTAADIQAKGISKAVDEVEAQIIKEIAPIFTGMVNTLVEKGYSLQNIAEAVIALRYEGIEKSSQLSVRQIKHEPNETAEVTVKRENKPKPRLHSFEYATILLDIGSSSRVAANHIIGAMADRTGISGKDFGKINISEDQSLVEIPLDCVDQAIEAMKGCKICGKPVRACVLAEAPHRASRPSGGAYKQQNKNGSPKNVKPGQFAKRKDKR